MNEEIQNFKSIKEAKNIIIIIFLIFLMSVIVYSLFWGPAKKIADSFRPAKTIMISAQGKVVLSPDIAKISFSVVSEGTNPKIVVEENNKKMNNAIDSVKLLGVDEKDIKTIQYNLNPRYEYYEENKKTFISGYTLTQTVLVKVRDLNKTAEILAGLPNLGINKIGSISFGIDDPEKYLTEARNKAFEKVKNKAGEIAIKNNIKLGKIIDVSEYQDFPQYSYKDYENIRMELSIPTPQIQPGTEEITSNVNITYEIK